nr:pyruvate dehydrogenase (acetyl-transferring) E1 component subunit alpha [Bauldia sp.]
MAKAARKSDKPVPVSQSGARARPTVVPASGDSRIKELTKEQELHAYENMLLIRRFEERAGQMYGMGLIGGFCHLYI